MTRDNQLLDPRDPHSADEELFGAESARIKARYTDKERLEKIHAELTRGFQSLAGLGPAVSVFGSAQTDPQDSAYQLARKIGYRLAEKNLAVITGGGPGCMEAAALGAREGGGRGVGLHIDIPGEPSDKSVFSLSLKFHYFFCRKLMFVRYASAFVVLPGGFGTLDELFEALTLIKTHKAKHFPVILVGSQFWDGLVCWLRSELVGAGMLSTDGLDLLTVTDDLDEVVDQVVHAVVHQRVAASKSSSI